MPGAGSGGKCQALVALIRRWKCQARVAVEMPSAGSVGSAVVSARRL